MSTGTRSSAPLRIWSWNMARRTECWHWLTAGEVDVALVQEAPRAGAESCVSSIPSLDTPWQVGGRPSGWCSAIVTCSDRVRVEPIAVSPLELAESMHHVPVSRGGTLAVGRMVLPDEEAITVVSVYAAWDRFPSSTSTSWSMQSDTSAHRVISDLCALIGSERATKMIVAGDWNLMYGYGEGGSEYWANRYRTVFDRMEAIGVPLVGPQLPNGEPASPWPPELPPESRNVPTFRTSRGTIARQLDYVFATPDLHERLAVRALNGAKDWGPSDHARVFIELAPRGGA